MKGHLLGWVAAVSLAGIVPAAAGTISLGTAAQFAVLAATTVTNTGDSVLTGDLGLSPGTSVTGFPPGVVNGTMHVADAVALQAQTDATTAYNAIAGLAPTQDLTGMDLGGLDLTSGVYKFNSSAQLTGTLTLTGSGPFVFQIGSTLTTASNSAVVTTTADCSCQVYWDVGSSATLGTGTAFEGTIIAVASDTLTTGATIIDGRAIALNGAVTLDDNIINATACIPEPSTWAMMVLGFAGLGFAGYRKAKGGAAALSVT